MNKQQADNLLGMIAGSYQNFELTKDRVKIWTEMLTGIEYNLAVKRLKNHIAVSKFAPTIAEILNPDGGAKKKQKIDPDTMSPAAISQGGYLMLI